MNINSIPTFYGLLLYCKCPYLGSNLGSCIQTHKISYNGYMLSTCTLLSTTTLISALFLIFCCISGQDLPTGCYVSLFGAGEPSTLIRGRKLEVHISQRLVLQCAIIFKPPAPFHCLTKFIVTENCSVQEQRCKSAYK